MKITNYSVTEKKNYFLTLETDCGLAEWIIVLFIVYLLELWNTMNNTSLKVNPITEKNRFLIVFPLTEITIMQFVNTQFIVHYFEYVIVITKLLKCNKSFSKWGFNYGFSCSLEHPTEPFTNLDWAVYKGQAQPTTLGLFFHDERNKWNRNVRT